MLLVKVTKVRLLNVDAKQLLSSFFSRENFALQTLRFSAQMLCKAKQPKKSNLLGPNDTELCFIEALSKTRNCNSLNEQLFS